MERIQTVNPRRVEWCLGDRGADILACARETGISESNLGKLLDGDYHPTVNQLERLAEFFGRSVLFFLDASDVPEKGMHSLAFRSILNQKPELTPKIRLLIERVERQRDIFVSLRKEIDEESLPRFVAPKINPKDVPGAAEKVRKWLRLGDKNDFQTYRQAVESRGILVFRSNGYLGQWQIAKGSPILGFSLFHSACPVIFVKKARFESRQSFTLFHELGHIILHRKSWIDDESSLSSAEGHEAESNRFAGLVLVPDALLDEVPDRVRPHEVSEFDAWLEPYRRQWGVSSEVILRRLLDVGRLTKRDYNAYRDWCSRLEPAIEDSGGNRQYRYREPRHLFGDPFVRVVLTSLSNQKITLNRASTFLDNLKIHDLHQLEQYCASV
ncbi:peptidase [Ahniella affigens]|uniref:Peptidase n=1 Tax=Ahniella affigens TaxID=2021234 RepID=A0A2P1PNM5_9GAMM|nr:XRE family transcriptional regulator [Ahniella affigens]AVP96440.1 peptidase [Ahniella affigens]